MATRPAPFRFSGALLERLGRSFGRRSETSLPESGKGEEDASPDQAARQALTMMLDEAVQVLKRLGLPCEPGFYRWDPYRLEWTFLSATMTPAERWAMVLEAPPGDGWRYATLPQVIRHTMPDQDSVRQAANVLEQGMACLNAATHGGAGVFESAIKLAVAWADFQVARLVPNSDRREPLKLYFPVEENEALAMPATGTRAPKGVGKQSGSKAKNTVATTKASGRRRGSKPATGA